MPRQEAIRYTAAVMESSTQEVLTDAPSFGFYQWCSYVGTCGLTLYLVPGVRFGTAELYDVVSRFSEIEDSVVVGQRVRRCQQNGESDIEDERVVMFIKMKSPSDALDDSLRSRIAEEIRRTLSTRHVPEEMWQVKDIPCTMNGKKIEKVVKALVAGEKVAMRGSIANPECLDEYVKFSTPGKLKARL